MKPFVPQPHCQHFGVCGGCDWQHLSYTDQLARKRQRLRELQQHAVGPHAPQVNPVIGMRIDGTGWPWRFRCKASFVFGESIDRALTIGHFAQASQHVVPIVECPVQADRANRIAFALHAQLARARVPAAGRSLRGILRHLVVRTTNDNRDAVAMLVVTRNDKSLRAPLRKFLAGPERPSGFLLNIHDKPGPYMVGRETIRLDGHSHVLERVASARYRVSPTAFFQTNVAAAAQLVDLVLAEAPAERNLSIADLYAGAGLFAIPLAQRGHRVIAIEEDAQAVGDGEANLRLNHLDRGVRFVHARVEDALPRLARSRLDFVVMDPPRSGCPQPVIAQLFGEIRPETVIYVSCNPEALAGDLPAMLDAGYAVRRVQPVDMFPHTTHIETVVSLSRTV